MSTPRCAKPSTVTATRYFELDCRSPKFRTQNAALRAQFQPARRNKTPAHTFSARLIFGGYGDGTRNFVAAVGCADPGDHSVVAVLQPLTASERKKQAPS